MADQVERLPCPLCGKTAAHIGESDAVVLVRCNYCKTFTIDTQLAAEFREGRQAGQVPTLNATERLSRAAADAWTRGGRLNIPAANWRGLGID